MTRYTVKVSPKADRQLANVRDRVLKARLLRVIHALGDNPRPPGCLKLVAEEDEWRVRVGDWRVVYKVDDGVLVVLVVTVAPRGGVSVGRGSPRLGESRGEPRPTSRSAPAPRRW